MQNILIINKNREPCHTLGTTMCEKNALFELADSPTQQSGVLPILWVSYMKFRIASQRKENVKQPLLIRLLTVEQGAILHINVQRYDENYSP